MNGQSSKRAATQDSDHPKHLLVFHKQRTRLSTMTDSPPGEMVVSSTTNPASVLPEEDDNRSEDHDVQVASPVVYGHHGHHHRHSIDESSHHIRRNHPHHLHHLHHSGHHQQLHSNEVDIDSTTNDQMHFVPPSVSPASEPMTPGMMVGDVSVANQAPSVPPPSVPPPVAVEVDVIPYSESQNHHLVQFYDHNQLSNQSMDQHHASTSSSSHHHHHVYQQSSSSSSLHMYQMDPNPGNSYNGNPAHRGSSSSYLPSIAHQQHPHQVIRMYHPIEPEETTSHHQLSELSNAAHHSSWSQPAYSQSLPNDISLHDEYHSQMLPPSEASSRTTSQTGICDGDREEDLSLNQRSHHLHHRPMNSSNTSVSHQITMCEDSLDARLHHDQQQSQIHHHHHLMQPNQDEIVTISDVPVESRARASLPTSYLYIEPVGDLFDLSEVVYGVFARKPIPQKTQFGPVEGVIMQFTGSRNIQPNLTVFISDSLILDQSDENKSNWMRFVRTATTFEEQNLILITKEQTHPNPENSRELITTTKFFFITTKPIGPRQELKVWYSKEYADRFRLKLLEDEIIQRPPTPSSEIPSTVHHHHRMNQDHFSDPNILESRSIADQEPLSIPAPIDHHMIQGHDPHQNMASECFQTQPHPETELRPETSYIALVPIQSEISVQPSTSELRQQQPSSTDLIPAAGHKLRNKIAKSQQQQQLQLQKTQQSNNQLIVSEPLNSVSNVPSASLDPGLEAIIRKERSNDHRCETCGKIFPRFYSLRRHMIMHSGEKKFKCPICHMSFSHVYNRNRHVKRHTTNGQSSSDKKKDSSESESSEPVTKSTASQPSSSTSKELPKMRITKIVISNPSTPKLPLPRSVKLIEIPQPVTSSNDGGGGGTTVSVDKSGGSSPSSDVPESTTPNIIRSMISKAKKMRAMLPSKRFKCNQCYKFFSSDERLQKHTLVHSSDDQVKPLSCTICSKRFFNNPALSCHMKIHRLVLDTLLILDSVVILILF